MLFRPFDIALLATLVLLSLPLTVLGQSESDSVVEEARDGGFNLSMFDEWMNQPPISVEELLAATGREHPAASYLPPGWTEEKFASATVEDLEGLPDSVLSRLVARCEVEGVKSDALVQVEINARRSLVNAARLEVGLPALPEPGKISYVKVLEEYELEEWGFVVYRTTYSDEGRWQQYLKRWKQIIDEQVDPSLGDGVQSAKDRLQFKFLEDKQTFQAASMADIAMHFQDMRGESTIPDGLDHSMCLVIDEASVASVLDTLTPNLALQPPFLLALAVDDLAMGSVDYPLSEDEPDMYTGYFKVAIDCLLHELYPIVGTMSLTPSDFAPWEGRVFKGLFLA